MKYAQIVDILDVSFLEVQSQAEPVGEKMKCVESFSLGFGDWGNVCTSRQMKEPHEIAASVLDYNSLWRVSIRRSMEEERPGGVRVRRIAISEDVSID